MKRKLYLFTVVLLFCEIIFAQHSPVLPNSAKNRGSGANINVVYYRCNFTIDSGTSKNISGTVATYFKTTAVHVSVISFDLNNLLFGSPVTKYSYNNF